MRIHCPFCQSDSFKIHQTNGHACNTIYRCMNCDRCFSERRFTGYSGLKLAPEKIVQIVNCLVEGVSIRATSRLVGVEKKTVNRIMLHAAELCQRVMDERIVNLRSHPRLPSHHARHGRRSHRPFVDDRGITECRSVI